jgi:hypothetical protein
MFASLAGMTLARVIPTALLAGLAVGKYTLHGGVIRWAAGTPAAGQIVAHLLPASGGVGALIPAMGPIVQVNPLLTGAGIVTGVASVVGGIGAVVGAGFAIATFVQSKKILKAVQQTMHVAELNLLATQQGFAALDHRLIALETTLRKVEQTATAIHTIA